MIRRVLIGVGANLEPVHHIRNGLKRLHHAFGDVTVSTFHYTPPLDNRTEQPDYVNGVVLLRTDASLSRIRRTLAEIESAEGRRRVQSDRYASRTLDLDLLAVENVTADDLPDRDLIDRDFMLIPSAEVWPDFVWPANEQTLRELATDRTKKTTALLEECPLNEPETNI